MKILYINSKSADYVQDLTYTGLVKNFGFQNIVDYPWNKKYHIPYRKYPKNIGYIKNSFILSLFNRSIKDIDYVFIGASKVDCLENYLEVIDSIPSKVPIVLIDGGDRSDGILKDLESYKRADLIEKVLSKRKIDYIFKREYLINTEYNNNIFPLPMSFNYNRMPIIDYDFKYDVSFWAVESHKIRKDVLDLLEDKFDCKSNGTQRNQKFSKYKRKGSEYLKELGRCKVVLNFRGGGWDTMRYWEVPAIGSFMISQKPGIIIPNNYRDEKEVVFCKDDLSDLVELCEYYLKHDDKRERIAKSAMEYTKVYHTDEKRVEYIFSKIGKV
ncbi:MAG TPA: glycosyltransferase family 1 protein [Arcobacter sp.]|nr:glycosyltransferase family 1 protein [Arcobacter sp.]